MTRSPLTYPLNRSDLSGGGDADLQTDVMRFMAILSLCLVAIFALVQSIPLTPPTPESPPPEAVTEMPAAPAPIEEIKPVTRETPRPQPEPAPRKIELPPAPVYRADPEPIPEPAPAPVDPVPLASPAAPVPAQAPAPATPEPQDEGFTLRFESDLALRRLVARNEIGLYAINSEKSSRMSVNRGSLSFWPASVPARFHEMHEDTVPDEVVAALRRSGTGGSVKWGVTLPSRLSRELDRFLSEYTGGALVIGGDGSMRRE